MISRPRNGRCLSVMIHSLSHKFISKQMAMGRLARRKWLSGSLNSLYCWGDETNFMNETRGTWSRSVGYEVSGEFLASRPFVSKCQRESSWRAFRWRQTGKAGRDKNSDGFFFHSRLRAPSSYFDSTWHQGPLIPLGREAHVRFRGFEKSHPDFSSRLPSKIAGMAKPCRDE